MHDTCVLRVVSFLLVTVCASTAAQGSTSSGMVVVRESDILYARVADLDLKLDLARPQAGGPFPVVVFLFGGGFNSGSRTSWTAEIIRAARRGYVGVAIDYRLTRTRDTNGMPRYPFPSQVHDAKCAIRWLRENANRYALDANRIGVVGFSAGGSLALILALTEAGDGLEGSCGGTGSSRVQAVVNIAGPTDYVLNHSRSSTNMELLLGGSPERVPDRYRTASPITYVGGDDAPVLTVVGSDDPMLPQERLLDDRMRAAGSDHALLVVQGIGHSLEGLVDFEKNSIVWDFLDKELKATQ